MSFRTEDERQNLLSDGVIVVTCIHLEAAVVGPQVNRGGDGAYTTLVHHLGGLCASNRKLEISVLLPVPEEEWKFLEEAIVRVAHEFNR